MTDQVKEAVEQRELDVLWLESLKESGHCGEGTLEYRSRAHWNDRIDRLLSELSRLSKLVEEVEKERETLRMIANRARHEPHDDAYADEPPDWALDPFNGDCADQCGYCGSWMTYVRPGKTQCDSCSDGQDLGAIARASLTHKAISGGGE